MVGFYFLGSNPRLIRNTWPGAGCPRFAPRSDLALGDAQILGR